VISLNEKSIDIIEIPAMFYRFLVSRAITSIVMIAFLIFYSWSIVSKYDSVFLAGLLITISLAVEIGLSFPIGHIIDVYNNTVVNLWSSVIMVLAFTLLLLNTGIFYIYGATAISVFGWTMKLDSFSAVIKKHTPVNSFKKANSMNNATSSASSILGTVTGGSAIIFFHYYFTYILIALSIISAILSVPVVEKSFHDDKGTVSAIEDIKSAGIFIGKITGFLVLAFFINGLFISLDTYSSGLFNIVLKTSPLYYTIFSLSVPLGTIFGTPMANMGYFKNDRPLVLAVLLLVFSPSLIVLSISRYPVIDIIDALIIGIILPLINIPLITRLMKIVPVNIYGKVMAFVKIFTGGASPVMGAVFSLLVLYATIPTVLLITGILVVPLSLYGFRIIPTFFKYEPR
jgi:DHA3 family macrolide efflux protein-like MFS transporter